MSHQPSHAREPYQPLQAQYPPQPYARNQPAVAYTAQPLAPGQRVPDQIIRPVRLQLSAAASFWYILGCIAFGGAYLAKVPAKKALAEAGMAQMTAAEKFWYVLMCIALGGGYLAKLPVKKALTEMH